jgi:hypothetical protein
MVTYKLYNSIIDKAQESKLQYARVNININIHLVQQASRPKPAITIARLGQGMLAIRL